MCIVHILICIWIIIGIDSGTQVLIVSANLECCSWLDVSTGRRRLVSYDSCSVQPASRPAATSYRQVLPDVSVLKTAWTKMDISDVHFNKSGLLLYKITK